MSNKYSTYSMVKKPAPAPIPRKDFVEKILNYEKQNYEPLISEYQELTASQADDDGAPYEPPEEYQLKNRYVNILPSKAHRVKLKTESKEEGADFINACHYECKDYRAGKYIVAQAPVPESFADFYQMVWDEDVHLIVMLTKVIEKNVIKAEEYWPPEKGKPVQFFNFVEDEKKKVLGKVIVTLKSEELNDKLAHIRILQLKKGNETREVTHIQYVQWPDHGTPKEEFEAFTKFFNLYRKFNEQRQHTILVHCSAGVGRSGVFLLIDNLLNDYHDNKRKNESFDIYKLVKDLRAVRPGSIQTVEQYIFIHEFLKEYIASDS